MQVRATAAGAQERVTQGPDGLVRIVLKEPFSDGTVAVDIDPLSLLCRLAASVPPPRFHTVRYAGVVAPASKLRPRIVPKPPPTPANDVEPSARPKRGGSRYRPWAELLKRCFAIDVERCARCGGRMKLVALLTDLQQVRRFLRGIGEPAEPPPREPARGPPYWKSRVQASRGSRRRARRLEARGYRRAFARPAWAAIRLAHENAGFERRARTPPGPFRGDLHAERGPRAGLVASHGPAKWACFAYALLARMANWKSCFWLIVPSFSSTMPLVYIFVGLEGQKGDARGVARRHLRRLRDDRVDPGPDPRDLRPQAQSS